MSLTSSSSLADAVAQYQDNLLWEGSLSAAQNALEALRFLLVARPEQMAQFEQSLRYADLAAEKGRLEAFIRSQTTSNRASFTRARMSRG